MKKNLLSRIYQTLAVSAMVLLMAASPIENNASKVVEPVSIYSESIARKVDVPKVKASVENVDVPMVTSAIDDPEVSLTEEEIELIALVTMAEAEGECEEGKRLVIDTILNRVDSLYFPDSIHEVVYQKNQFSSMWNGRVDRVEATEEVCKLVREELALRTNSDVVFFTAGNYGKYGNPMFQIGNHYFSSY